MLPGRQWRPARQVNPMSVKWNPAVTASLAAFRPDAVVLSGYVHPTVYMAARWCRANGVPYAIASETTARSTTMSGPKWLVKKALAGWLVKGMAFGLPTGREAAAYMKALGAGEKPMRFFPNTPDTAPIVAAAEAIRAGDGGAALRASLGIPAGTAIVLFVGRMIEAKRPLDLVEAFRRLEPAADRATLVMVGDGELMPAVRQAAEGLPAVFTGWVKDAAVTAGLMAIARVMALPSQHETWGAVVNESMAAGTPVVAADRVGAAVEMIESGRNGFIHPVGDVAGLTDALRRLIDDDALAAALGKAARETAVARNHLFAAGNLVVGARNALGRTG
jgi:glycosyltransferase involved in cell wall biosynthesis